MAILISYFYFLLAPRSSESLHLHLLYCHTEDSLSHFKPHLSVKH